MDSGDIRILAALSDEPVPSFPDAPTAASLGHDVTAYNWRGFYVGGDVCDQAYQRWVSDLETLYNTEAWKDAATSIGLIPIWRGSEEFEAYVEKQTAQMEEILRNIGVPG